jgi:hypothetical protein
MLHSRRGKAREFHMRATFRLRFFACLLLGLACATPAAEQTARVLATDPPDGSVLNVGEALYVRLEYAGEQPLRFRGGADRRHERR